MLKGRLIKKISELKYNLFTKPTVITVKKDRTVKKALDAKALNQAIDKDKYLLDKDKLNVNGSRDDTNQFYWKASQPAVASK